MWRFLYSIPLFLGDYIYNFIKMLKSLYLTYTKITDWWSWLEFYFLFIKFPPKFKSSAYILFYFFILFICVCFCCCFCAILLSHPYQSVFVSSKTISYKETHHFYQNKMLKIKKINLKHRNVTFLIQPPFF